MAHSLLSAALWVAVVAAVFLTALVLFALFDREIPALRGHLPEYGAAFSSVCAGAVATQFGLRQRRSKTPRSEPSAIARWRDGHTRTAGAGCIVEPMRSVGAGLLGVDRARAGRPVGSTRSADVMPPYVERQIDRELRGSLNSNAFVLLIGDATTGKTRTIYEAALRGLPDHVVVAPQDRGSVAEAVDRALESRKSILWLDKLYKFAGPEGLTRAQVDRLLNARRGHRVILASMTGADYARFIDPSDDADQQTNRDVRDQARIFFLDRRFTADETARAQEMAASDARIAGWLENTEYGLPEYLAAGPELYDQWQAELHGGGTHARGAALIGAAVDLLRAGLSNPLPVDLIERVHTDPHYLPPRAVASGAVESPRDAWNWAMTARATAAALMAVDGDPTRVTVFGYLADELERLPVPAHQVPDGTLRAALTVASAPEAMRIGQKARNYGRYLVALQAFGQAAESRKAHLGANGAFTLASRNKVARALRGLGRLRDAELELRAVLELQYDAVSVDRDPHALTTRDNLARVLRASGHPLPALTEHRAVLQARAHVLGTDHPDTLTSRNGLARAYRDLGRLQEAETEHRAVLEARRRSADLGERHPDTLTSRADLAVVWRLRGRPEQAREALHAVLQLRVELLGLDHPDTLAGRRELALALRDSGRFEESEAEFLAVYQGRIRSLYEDHPDTATSHDELQAARRTLEAARRVQDASAEEARTGTVRLRLSRSRDDHPAPDDVLGMAGQLPHVSQIEDPTMLGVHRAAADSVGLSTYCARDVDDHLRGALQAGAFALVVGGAASGKSRTVFEAMRAMLPNHVLIAPRGRESVAAAVALAATLHRCVLWLDDLDRFAGPDGLTLPDVAALIGSPKHQRIVLASISTAMLERFTDRSDGASRQANRDVIRQAQRIHLPDRFTPAEQIRFDALRHRLGRAAPAASLPELLALPTLLERVRIEPTDDEPQSRGVALVRAAIDCRRAGVIRPLPTTLLAQLHAAYLPSRRLGGASLTDPALRGAEIGDSADPEAWRWATAAQPVLAALYSHPAAALETGKVVEPDHPSPMGVLSYLVDEFDRLAGPEQNIPDAVLAHVLADADATEAMRIGQTATGYGRYRMALEAFTSAWQQREARLSSTDPGALASRNKAARALRLTGAYEESEREHAEIVELLRRVLGPNDPATLTSRDDHGCALYALGRLTEARAEHRAVLEARTLILGPHHPDTLSSRNNLARVQRDLSESGEAEANLRAVLAARGQIFGPEHSDTLTTRNDLAILQRLLGLVAEAETEHEAVFEARVTLLGKEHPATLAARHERAVCLAALGSLEYAADEFETVLKTRARVLGEDHPKTVETQTALEAVRT